MGALFLILISFLLLIPLFFYPLRVQLKQKTLFVLVCLRSGSGITSLFPFQNRGRVESCLFVCGVY